MSEQARLKDDFASIRNLMIVATPLVLSQLSNMIMQFTDRWVLSHYGDKTDIGAIGPAFFVFLTLAGVFIGVTGYTATFVAHYTGSGRPQMVGPTVWQGFYLALAGSLPVMLSPLLAPAMFRWFEHEPSLIEAEMTYLTIHCVGAPLFLINGALTGYFSGRNDNVRLMLAQLAGVVVNGVFCLLCVAGWQSAGISPMGIAGAGYATLIGQAVILLIMAAMFFTPWARSTYQTWTGKSLNLWLTRRIFRFGFPSGMRFSCDLFVWSSFFLFIGGLGTSEAAASGIVFGLNTFAFFPLIGIMMAVSVLVGQAQGAMRPDLAEKIGWRGLWIGQAWMLIWVAIFLLFPEWLISWFRPDEQKMSQAEFEAMVPVCVKLLKFVAVYCIVDGVNVIVMGALQGAGDTRWTLVVSMTLHAAFFATLLWLKHIKADLYTLWAAATVFIFLLALAWLVRFKLGAWKKIQVIEPELEK